MADKVLGVMDDNGTKIVLAYKGYLGKLVVMQIEPDAETYEDGSSDARIIALKIIFYVYLVCQVLIKILI